MSGEARGSSPFHPDRPVPAGGLVFGQDQCRETIARQLRDLAAGTATPVAIVGPPSSGRTTMMNFGRHLASGARVLTVDLDLSGAVVDLAADVARAVITGPQSDLPASDACS
jgi:hypothetical protein